MLIYKSFLKKELAEFLSHKKMLYLCPILLLYPLLINLLARHPILQLSHAMVLLLALGSCCVGEMVYLSLVEEFHFETLDVILVSPISRLLLMFYKITVPMLLYSLCTLLGLILNDAAIALIPQFSAFLPTATRFHVILILCCGLISASVEFCVMIKQRQIAAKQHTMLLFLVGGALGGLALLALQYGIFFFLLPCTFLIVPAAVLSAHFLQQYTGKQPYQNQLIDLFQTRSFTPLTAIQAKNLQQIRPVVLLELGALLAVAGFLQNALLYYGTLCLLSSFGARRLLYPGLAVDQISHAVDIIYITCKKPFYLIYSAILPFVISLAAAALAMALFQHHMVGTDLILIAATAIFSCLYACFIPGSVVKRPRDAALGSILVGILSVATYLLEYVMLFML